MVIEILERLRGFDKWVATEATVESSQEQSHATRGASYETSSDVLMWTDTEGQRHRTAFTVSDDSSLYQPVAGSKISIRYDPADPEGTICGTCFKAAFEPSAKLSC